MGEVARALDITVSTGGQTYALRGVADPIAAGVRMVQPDIVKMGGISGLMQCAALCHAHGVELVPHQTQPTIGHAANMHSLGTVMHLAKSFEVTDNPCRLNALFKNAPEPQIGARPVSSVPGLGLELDLEKLEPHVKPP